MVLIMACEFQIAKRKELKRWGRATEGDRKGDSLVPISVWRMRHVPGNWGRGVVLVVTNISRDKRQFQIRPHVFKADSDGEAVSFWGWEISLRTPLPFSYRDMEVWGEWSCFVSRVRWINAASYNLTIVPQFCLDTCAFPRNDWLVKVHQHLLNFMRFW